jgi:hypothetical protein
LIQGQVWIGRLSNALKQCGQNGRQLTPLMRIACHRLQVRISRLNALKPVRLKKRVHLGWF